MQKPLAARTSFRSALCRGRSGCRLCRLWIFSSTKFLFNGMRREFGYLDVLPVPRRLFSRVRIRRSSLGGGTFRVGCGGFLLRPGLKLGYRKSTWIGMERIMHTAAISSIEFVLYALRALALANCTLPSLGSVCPSSRYWVLGRRARCHTKNR